MSNAEIHPAGPAVLYHFRPTRYRLVIAVVVSIGAIGLTAYRFPAALWFSIPFFAVILAVGAFSVPGLILTREGIEWYAVRPGWRFRKVPWESVLDVRGTFLGLGGQVRLVVKWERYERWVWGRPRPGEERWIEIWPAQLHDREQVRAAIEEVWSQWRRASAGGEVTLSGT